MSAPNFVLGDPSPINTGSVLFVSVSLGNIGSAAASGVFITSVSIGAAPCLSPAAFPLWLGDIAIGMHGGVHARFGLAGLSVGGKYLLTVKGRYGTSVATSSFTVTRSIVIPPVSIFPVKLLRAHVSVTVKKHNWTYTFFNDEPPSSSLFIAVFSLDLLAPITVIASPAGWAVETDNVSYVAWHATDQHLPYPHQIPPGQSLGGFQIQSSTLTSMSTRYVITSWNHQTDSGGLVAFDVVLSPSR